MFDLITIGDATLDTFLVLDEHDARCQIDKKEKLLCIHYAEKTFIDQAVQSVGGNASNIAVGATKLGLKTAMVTELGDDINGHIIAYELEHSGVDPMFIKICKGQMTRYSIILNYETERTVLSSTVKRTYTFPKLKKTDWIYYTSMGKGFENIQDKLIKHLTTHPDTRLALNPGSYQLRHGIKKIRQILPHTDLLFINKEEGQELVGKPVEKTELFHLLHKKGVKIVVMTDSTNGSFVSDREKEWYMPIYPVKTIAKTGAGDAYASGFLSAIHHGLSIPDAMCWGTANASGVIQEFGAQNGLLSLQKMKKRIKKYHNIVPSTSEKMVL